MTDTTVENGCLQMLPGVAAAKQLTLGHHDDPAVPWPGAMPMDCLMQKGDILLLSAYTPHQSTFNLSGSVRWSLDLRFQKVGEPNGRAPQPSFTVRSRRDSRTEERSFASWRAKHEQASSVLAECASDAFPQGRHMLQDPRLASEGSAAKEAPDANGPARRPRQRAAMGTAGTVRVGKLAAHLCTGGGTAGNNTYGHKIDGLDDVGAVTTAPRPLSRQEDPDGTDRPGLSPAEIAFFKEFGYVIKRRLLPPASLQPFVDAAWAVAPGGVSREDPSTWLDAGARWDNNHAYHAEGGVCTNPPDENCGGRLWWDCSSEPFLRATSWSAATLGVVEALIGGPVKRPGRCRGMYTIWPRRGDFASSAAAGATLGPHIDTETEQLLAVTYLSEVGPSGGNFVVWPGSHRLMHEGFEDCINPRLSSSFGRRMAAVREAVQPVEFVGGCGDVIFIHNRMVHSSGHNLGSAVRFASIQDFQRVRPRSRLKWGT
eukprot:SAG22_NODE_7_length_40155_cov_25.241356_31_plen_485_part_00